MELPVKVNNLALGYNELEDRLILFASNSDQEALPLLLTRKKAGQLVDGLAQVLERSNALAVRSTAETRTEIVLMERQMALGAPAALGGAGQETRLAIKSANRLIARIDVTVEPNEFLVEFFDPSEVVAKLVISRFDLHRLIEIIRRQTDLAGWSLDFGTPWLNAEQTHFSIN
jgi:hypothetical protein